jgi:hypothetical protein
MWVDLEIRTMALDFSLPASEDVIDDLSLSFIEIDGISSVTAYSPRKGRSTVAAHDRPGGLALRDSSLTVDGLSLSRLNLSQGSRIKFRKAPMPGAWVVALECHSPCPGRQLQLERTGRHEFQLSGAERTHPYDTAATFGTLPGTLAAILDPDTTYLHLSPGSRATRPLIEHLLVDSLSFDVLEERGSGSRSTSGILGGTIYFPAVANRSHSVRPRQWLRVNFERVWIEHLRFQEDTLVVVASGEARNVRVGPAGTETDLTPSWLEVLYARHGLLAAFVLGSIPVSIAVLQWLHRRWL